jgi:AMP-binding enzyme C-terminal domain/Phosphopantetheine attachment site
VKIRGFRVELGEIETAIAENAGVEHAAVVLRTDNDVESLVAFVAPRKDEHLDTAELRANLRKRLPPYMVPGRFEIIDQVPRLSSGKVDRKILKNRPLTVAESVEGEQQEARSDIEAVLLAATQSVFPGQAIPLDGDFFTEIGGHSLLAAQFISIVRKTKGCAAITLQDVYSARTLGAMSALLEKRGAYVKEKQGAAEAVPPSRASAKRRFLCGLAQAAVLPLMLTLQAAPWLAIFMSYSLFSSEDAPFFADIAMVFAGFTVVYLFNYAFVPIAKWAIIGRTKPGVYPLWGSYYFRVWVVQHLMSLVHLKLMQARP